MANLISERHPHKVRERKRLPNLTCFVDGGISVATFDRQDFNRMISAVESGEVTTLIVNDISRFGRDYLNVGYYKLVVCPFFLMRESKKNRSVLSLQFSGRHRDANQTFPIFRQRVKTLGSQACNFIKKVMKKRLNLSI